jgi:diguanylate cyclase (GGDEF)-like protein/PAS domain S-box-containing protein
MAKLPSKVSSSTKLKGLWPLLVVTSGLLLAAALALLYETVINDAKRQTAELAAGYKRLIAQDLADLDRFISLAGRRVLIERTLTPDQAHQLFVHRQSSHPVIKDLAIIDATAGVVAMVRDGPVPDLSQRDYFRFHVDNADSEFHVSPPQPSLFSPDVHFMALSRPFRNRENRLVGVAVGLLDVAKLSQHYRELIDQQDATVSLLSRSGRVLWEFRDTSMSQAHRTNEARELPPSLPSTAEDRTQHGEPSIVHWEPIGEYDMAVRAEVGRNQLLGQWHRAVFLAVAAWLVFSLASFFAIARVSAGVSLTQARHRRFEQLVENAGDLIVLTDREGRLTYLSPNLLAFLGESSSTFIGHHIKEFIHRDDLPKLEALITKIVELQEGSALAEYRVRHADGQWRWQSASITPHLNERNEIVGLVATIRDVTEARSERLMVAHQAQHDALTGLPNRASLASLITRAISESGEREQLAAILFIDLDKFKPINDEFGHAVGDQLLVQVARRMSNALRSPDIVTRIGGDEFLAILQRLDDTEEAQAIADRIIHQIRQPYQVNGQKLFISCSIGLAIYPADGHDQSELMARADKAMYQAKRAGGSKAVRAQSSTQG